MCFFFQKLKSLSLNVLEVSPKPLQLLTEAMHHMTTLNLSCVLRTGRYDGVLKAISVSMPYLKSLDIPQRAVPANAIELLLPTEGNPPRGCPQLVYLNLMDSLNFTVELLKKILLCLPKLRYLKDALLMKTLTELTEKEMDAETGRCLTYFYSDWSCDCCCHEIYYDAFSRAPVFTRLNNITEVGIVATEESEQLLKDL